MKDPANPFTDSEVINTSIYVCSMMTRRDETYPKQASIPATQLDAMEVDPSRLQVLLSTNWP